MSMSSSAWYSSIYSEIITEDFANNYLLSIRLIVVAIITMHAYSVCYSNNPYNIIPPSHL